jgi:hypothetical protein
MAMRAPDTRVTFIRPFVLKGLPGVQPAGTYSVELDKKPADAFSLLGMKRTSTWIRICRNFGTSGVLQLAQIDPLDLAAALIRDTALTEGIGTWVEDDERG